VKRRILIRRFRYLCRTRNRWRPISSVRSSDGKNNACRADADYDRAWPGHRDPIDDPTARAELIIYHHEERAWRVLDALRRKCPCDTWTVSDDLFGELEGIHILHGPGESYAHLEHLEREGAVVREGDRYRLADGVAERLDEMDGEQ
jgi:hypothetical protein